MPPVDTEPAAASGTMDGLERSRSEMVASPLGPQRSQPRRARRCSSSSLRPIAGASRLLLRLSLFVGLATAILSPPPPSAARRSGKWAGAGLKSTDRFNRSIIERRIPPCTPTIPRLQQPPSSRATAHPQHDGHRRRCCCTLQPATTARTMRPAAPRPRPRAPSLALWPAPPRPRPWPCSISSEAAAAGCWA